jgi:tripartite-type tricarboxylate transporter receptor subunit TctC
MKPFITTAIAIVGLSTLAAHAEFPEKNLQGIIQWGAGGSTDIVMRAVTPHAEEVLGADVVMTNRTGGVGAIATKYVMTQKPDGYTLLMGAENPQLYKVMGLGDIDYSDFIPIDILARGIPILVANNDAPFNTFKEFVDYVQAHPKDVKIGSTGPGGLPSVVTAMMSSQVDLPVTAVPFDGDGPALTALMGGALDVMPAVLGAAIESVKAGRIKAIAVFDTEPTPLLPDVPVVTADYPGFSEFLPWGPFFGIFVKQGTPEDAVTKLQAAYQESANQDEFKKLMDDRGFLLMNIGGEEAKDFLTRWQSVTSWLMFDAGIAKTSPEEFGIPKP